MRRMMVWGVLLLAHVLAWGGGMTPVVSVPDAMVFGTTAVVPLRPMAELLGAELSYADKAVTIRLGTHEITFHTNQSTAQVDGSTVQLPFAVFTRVGFSYVPLRPLITGLSGTLALDTKSSTFTVIYQGITLHLPIKPQSCAPADYLDNDWELYVVNTDGTGLKRLTYTNDYEGYPAFAPDSQRFVYDNGGGGICERRLQDPQPTQIVSPRSYNGNEETCDSPCYTPDGKEVIFEKNVSLENGNYRYQIFSINLADHQQHWLANGFSPCLSPNGLLMAFVNDEYTKTPWVFLLSRTDGHIQPIASGDEAFFNADGNTLIIRDDLYDVQLGDGANAEKFSVCQVSPSGKTTPVREIPQDQTTLGHYWSSDKQIEVFRRDGDLYCRRGTASPINITSKTKLGDTLNDYAISPDGQLILLFATPEYGPSPCTR